MHRRVRREPSDRRVSAMGDKSPKKEVKAPKKDIKEKRREKSEKKATKPGFGSGA